MAKNNMFKNLIKKITLIIAGFGMISGIGMSLIPILAQAKENHGLRFSNKNKIENNVEAKKGEREKDGEDKDEDDIKFGDHFNLGLGIGNINLKMENTVSGNNGGIFKDVIKQAKKTYKKAVKQANETHRNAIRVARDKFNASIKTATNISDKILAFKTYLADKLAAFKIKQTSIEAAFQALIDTNFFNHNPVANAQSVSLSQNTSKAITLTGSDPESSMLTFTVISNPIHGTLSGTAPNITYTPTVNFTGTDSFTFKVNDGSLNSPLATVSITVNP